MRNLLTIIAACAIFGSCGNPEATGENQTSDTTDTELTHRAWSQDATIYEANIRQYSPEGTFNAFTSDLERIKNMGIKIIWLMPISPIGEENRKGSKGSYYSVRDYKAVNPEFGTMEDFKALVKKAHELDMKIILDWVANHSAFDNVWTKSNPEWYNLDSLGKLQPPSGTDWWDVADLNYDNAEMRAAMIDAMSFWLQEADVDGYRCDVAEMVPMDFWMACRDSLEKVKPDVFMLAEGENPELHKAFDMTYAFEFLHLMNGIAKGEKEVGEIDAYMARHKDKYQPEDYRMYFTTSHDENSWNGTVFERLGAKGNETFAVLAFTIDGMPMVYSGQEAAMDYALKFFEKDTILWNDYKLQDFYTKLLQLNRTNPALYNGAASGDFERITTGAEEAVYAFSRTKDSNKVIVVCNLKNSPSDVKLKMEIDGEYKALFGGDLETMVNSGMELEPYAYYVFYKP